MLMGKEEAVQRHGCEFASLQVHIQRSCSSELFFSNLEDKLLSTQGIKWE